MKPAVLVLYVCACSEIFAVMIRMKVVVFSEKEHEKAK